MTILREAAQQALEACEQRLPLKGQAAIIDELNNLRAALAQQAEPQDAALAQQAEPQDAELSAALRWPGLHRPVGFWVLYPGSDTKIKFTVFVRLTDEQIKNTEALLGWGWEDA